MNDREINQKIYDLAKKWQEGTITEAEKQEFNAWYYSFDDTQFEDVSKETPDELKDRLFQAILRKEKIKSPAVIKKMTFVRAAAAAILIISLSFAGYFMLNDGKEAKTAKIEAQNDVSPGGNKAILTLADGRRISLSDGANTELVNRAGIKIYKKSDGQLIYDLTSTAGENPNINGFNTIQTPAGGQYQVNLSDGTKVWLNSQSSIHFPVVFNDDERKVSITGEAYFEVAHDPGKPFIVESREQEIKVLGTHFNVMSYSDEASVKTTLLQGSVAIRSALGSIILKPGEQSEATSSTIKLIKDIDIDNVVAWKNGRIQFSDADIQSIMRVLSRWYDIDVEYSGPLSTSHFGGSVSRSKNLSEVLKVLEATGYVHFKIKGRRVTVMP